MHGGWWHVGWMWWPWLAVLIGLALLIWLGLGVARARGRTEESPEEVLKRRYARGEVDKEEFDRILKDLRK